MSSFICQILTIKKNRVQDLPQENLALLHEAAHALDPFGCKSASAHDARLRHLWSVFKTL